MRHCVCIHCYVFACVSTFTISQTETAKCYVQIDVLSLLVYVNLHCICMFVDSSIAKQIVSLGKMRSAPALMFSQHALTILPHTVY